MVAKARLEFSERSFRSLCRMEARHDLLREQDFGFAGIASFAALSLEPGDLVLRAEGEQLVIAPHQLVGDRHELAEHLARRLGNADIVVQRLRHLVDAVEAFEQWQRQNALRLLAVMALQLAAHQQIELLIGAPELDVRLERHRVVALRQRIEELVDGDGLPLAVALREVLALEHPRDGVLGGEADNAIRSERREPFRTESDLGLCAIEYQKDLVGVGRGVSVELLSRERRARDVASRRIADHSREVANQKDDVMAEVLQLSELVELYSVTEVQIGACRI